MKWIKTYESFRIAKEDQPLNEEFILAALMNFFKNMQAKAKAAINKTQGGKEVDKIFNKYLGLINVQLKKILPGFQLRPMEQTLADSRNPEKVKESILIKEADEAPIIDAQAQTDETSKGENKYDPKALKSALGTPQTPGLILKTIKLNVEKAKAEMEAVLKSKGGAEKNPDLKNIIDAKVREFDLSLLNAEVDYLKLAKDETAVKKLSVNVDKVAKEINAKYAVVGKEGSNDIKVGEKTLKLGQEYRYQTDEGVRTIVIKGEVDEEDLKGEKVKAAYVYGDKAGVIQNFTADKIDLNFNPEKGATYGYYSDNNKRVIEVEVVGDPDNEGKLKVKTGNSEFNVRVGELLDKKEKK